MLQFLIFFNALDWMSTKRLQLLVKKKVGQEFCPKGINDLLFFFMGQKLVVTPLFV